jgi:hypothetical protein
VPDTDTAALVAELWDDYETNNAHETRERLILHYSPLVKFVAGRVGAGLPQNIEQTDLVSYGIFGLIDAIDKFDPARGYKFETYAISRIRGRSSTSCARSTGCPAPCGPRPEPSNAPTRSSRTSCAAPPRTERSPRSST